MSGTPGEDPSPPFSLHLYAHPAREFVTSHFVHPGVLFGYRLLCLIYVAYWDCIFIFKDSISNLRFFTDLNYTILTLYLLGQVVVSCIHYFYWRKQTTAHRQLATPLHMALWCMSEICFPNSFFLDVVYWTLLWEKGENVLSGSLHSHALNFFVILGEVFLNKLSFVHAHLLLLIEFGIGYLVFAWSWHYAGRGWIYDFLDVNRLIALAYYPAFIIGMLACFYFWKLLTWLRNRAAARRRPAESVSLVMDRRNMAPQP